MRRVVLVAALAAAACAERPPAPPPPTAPPDSLALTTPDGVQVWFVGARAANDSAGSPCVERVMEIRRDGRRIPIPLLYTGETPILADDSTLRAQLWLHCRPHRPYEVNLRTGQPIPK